VLVAKLDRIVIASTPAAPAAFFLLLIKRYAHFIAFWEFEYSALAPGAHMVAFVPMAPGVCIEIVSIIASDRLMVG
tara:strand:+ start:29 stop:256 length:228 start_codon:yes stop_codon:yes gene_type:complete